jgi:hypothetical protein
MGKFDRAITVDVGGLRLLFSILRYSEEDTVGACKLRAADPHYALPKADAAWSYNKPSATLTIVYQQHRDKKSTTVEAILNNFDWELNAGGGEFKTGDKQERLDWCKTPPRAKGDGLLEPKFGKSSKGKSTSGPRNHPDGLLAPRF